MQASTVANQGHLRINGYPPKVALGDRTMKFEG